MRNVWILGGDAQVKLSLERALESHKDVSEWCVRLATSVSDIPEDDILSNGTVMICDAFHPTYPAFEGVKALRGSGFGGAIFLSGEPSPELAVAPFQQHRLTGYFPSFDRADWAFVAGVLRCQLYFKGELNVKNFLMPQGRSSSELIKNFKDFNNFGAKLAVFVQKFGIDLAQVRKLLMGLGLAHIKGSSAGPHVEKPFHIHFGMDPLKVILGVSTFSRGCTADALLNEFIQVVSNLKEKKPSSGTIFPEFYHVAQATQNLILMTGHSDATKIELDPLYIVGALPFPKIGNKVLGPINFFTFQNIQATAESTQAPVKAQANEQVTAPAKASWDLVSPEVQVKASLVAATSVEVAPQGILEEADLGSILSEPQVIGDSISVVDPNAPKNNTIEVKRLSVLDASSSSSASKLVPLLQSSVDNSKEKLADKKSTNSSARPLKLSSSNSEASQFDWAPKIEMAEKEVEKLKAISTAMAQDIRRLMKERRIPSTDRELRDAVAQLEEKLKRSNQDRSKYQRLCEEKDSMIETLKLQVDTLRKKVA